MLSRMTYALTSGRLAESPKFQLLSCKFTYSIRELSPLRPDRSYLISCHRSLELVCCWGRLWRTCRTEFIPTPPTYGFHGVAEVQRSVIFIMWRFIDNSLSIHTIVHESIGGHRRQLKCLVYRTHLSTEVVRDCAGKCVQLF